MNQTKGAVLLTALLIVFFFGVMFSALHSQDVQNRQETEQMKACVSAGMEWRDAPGIGVNYECVRK